ncbi:hypothetical protein ACFY93_16870 [Streptomyces sp. NPDC008313]|uniref:hypothetical protein n=1 Tax=Streptomyces sp. NPDC008313 TaxID=3364826 RepID=UPI0036E90DDB
MTPYTGVASARPGRRVPRVGPVRRIRPALLALLGLLCQLSLLAPALPASPALPRAAASPALLTAPAAPHNAVRDRATAADDAHADDRATRPHLTRAVAADRPLPPATPASAPGLPDPGNRPRTPPAEHTTAGHLRDGTPPSGRAPPSLPGS